MPKALNVPIPKVKRLIKTQTSPIIRKRLEILLMHAQGRRSKDIKRLMNIDDNGLYRVINKYNRWGLSKFLEPDWGRMERVKLSDKQIDQVISWMGDINRPGFCFDRYFCTLLCKDIYKKWGIRFGPGGLRKRLIKEKPRLRKKHFFRRWDPVKY